MAVYKGHNGAVTVDTQDVGQVVSFEVEDSVNEQDANVMGSDWTDVEGGQRTMTGTITVLMDSADAGQAVMVPGATVAAVFMPESNTTGRREISGNFLVTSAGDSVSVGDNVQQTFGVRNKGTVTIGTVT